MFDRIDALRAGLREGDLVEGVHYTFALRFADGVVDCGSETAITTDVFYREELGVPAGYQ